MPPSTVPTPSLLRALRTSITSTSARPPAKPRSLSRLQPQVRHLNTTRLQLASRPPTSRDRGPASNEDTQTDFGRLDIFGQNREPSVAINECYSDGFRLGDGRIVRRAGVLCVGGEAFWWRPWEQQGKASGKSAGMSLGVMKNGQLELDGSTLGILEMVWPRPGKLYLHTCYVLYSRDKAVVYQKYPLLTSPSRSPHRWYRTIDSPTFTNYPATYRRVRYAARSVGHSQRKCAVQLASSGARC